MHDQDRLADRFQEQRPHLRAVAYRMLGSISEAEDALQEAWLRVSRSDTSDVDNLGGWFTTVVARVALNMLQARKAKREESLEERLPDPIVSTEDEVDPEHEALIADSVGLALLVVLETLAPAERLAFVLHDMFAVPFDKIASITGRSPARSATARKPRPSPCAGPSARTGCGPGPPAQRRRCVLRRRTGGRLRRASGGTGPRHRAA
jgi:RNA polymerase sigma-70 factor (ECF subfamily)